LRATVKHMDIILYILDLVGMKIML